MQIIKNIFSIIQSIIFWTLSYMAVAIVAFYYFILTVFTNQDKEILIDYSTRIWVKIILILLKIIFRINYKIINSDNIPEEACIIACKHQSMWDTIIFHTIFNHPSYIYKKELLKIPFYGWYISKMPGISVDRNGGASELKNMVKQSKNILQKGYKLVIFPQGTRTKPHQTSKEVPYKSGIAAIYSTCNTKVVPVALNSGQFWGKGLWIKNSGTITIEFLKPIEPGVNKKEFMKILEEKIETQSNKLIVKDK